MGSVMNQPTHLASQEAEPALTPEMLEKLRTDGLTPFYVAERLGVGPRTATRLLREAGSHRVGHHNFYTLTHRVKKGTKPGSGY